MKIEKGLTYLTRDGQRVGISDVHGNFAVGIFLDRKKRAFGGAPVVSLDFWNLDGEHNYTPTLSLVKQAVSLRERIRSGWQSVRAWLRRYL